MYEWKEMRQEKKLFKMQ